MPSGGLDLLSRFARPRGPCKWWHMLQRLTVGDLEVLPSSCETTSYVMVFPLVVPPRATMEGAAVLALLLLLVRGAGASLLSGRMEPFLCRWAGFPYGPSLG